MIGISKLYCDSEEASDRLRYRRRSHAPPFSAEIRPVVVWNCTQRCNLNCIHCYASSASGPVEGELTSREARSLIDDLAGFAVPVILFSGGEPLMRADIVELIAYAGEAGLRTVLSTNGTLITEDIAGRLREAGLNYAGVSLDGTAEVNDRFRGRVGAFEEALAGIRNCRQAGIKVGLRMTMTRGNLSEIPAMFDLIERERIDRACFYHLVCTGRGSELRQDVFSHEDTRAALDTIIDRTAALHAAGRLVEVLTVDNNADGPYVYLRLLCKNSTRAAKCIELLRMQAGNGSGVAIGCIGPFGDVHPDQFWRTCCLGNVRERPFSEIFSDTNQPMLAKLRDRKQYLKGRCGRCRWLDVCNGNLRARAEAETGDCWGDDPACYLTEEEIA